MKKKKGTRGKEAGPQTLMKKLLLWLNFSSYFSESAVKQANIEYILKIIVYKIHIINWLCINIIL